MSAPVSRTDTSPASLAAAVLDNFHQALDDERGRGNSRLRMTLHQEEHDELQEALKRIWARESYGDHVSSDLRASLARELADVVYVAYGTAHAFNIDLDVALMEIHRAAMSKLFPPNGVERVVREGGKICKPPGFVPPNMTEAVR